jgi:hypothetical protein
MALRKLADYPIPVGALSGRESEFRWATNNERFTDISWRIFIAKATTNGESLIWLSADRSFAALYTTDQATNKIIQASPMTDDWMQVYQWFTVWRLTGESPTEV